MGFSGRFLYAAGRWRATPTEAGRFLLLEVEHSDIATVTFGQGRQPWGRYHLGHDPGDYWEDPTADSVDHPAVAAAFQGWVAAETGREVQAASVEALMAKPGRGPVHMVVEETAQSLLQLAGLPLPDEWNRPLVGRYAQMVQGPYDAAYRLPDGRKVNYRQFRYVLGDGPDFFGVWDQLAPRDGPVMTTPKRPGGWRVARRAWADHMNRLPPEEWLVE